jgi:hypothetical protein
MSSPKQRDANRRNAQLSTGPRSAEGKAKSSRNALKTGLYARGNIIGHEAPWLLEELIVQFTAEHQPASPTERSLVDQLIHTEWMLRRYCWLETEVWRAAGSRLSPEKLNHTREGHSFIEEPSIARLQRQRRAMQRAFAEILAELRRVKSENQAKPPVDYPPEAYEQPDPEPEPLESTPDSPEIGFVSSNRAKRRHHVPRPPAHDPAAEDALPSCYNETYPITSSSRFHPLGIS